MQEHGQIIVFLFTSAIFALVMALVLTRKITERFAILWMSISIFLLLASSLAFRYLFLIARVFGIPYPPSALFLIVIFGLSLLVIELFSWVSMLNERSRLLAQQVALLRDALDRHVASQQDPARPPA